ncbi:MAG: hypothetical protein IKA88_00195 [Clostridia bacterium]|nr:hypothetical protein [Clostridia bacterium]
MNEKEPKKAKNKTEKGEDKRLRSYFVRLFGKYDFRNERQFLFFGKWLIFIVLVIVEALMLLQQLDRFEEWGGWKNFFALLVLESALTLSVALKLFVIKHTAGRMIFNVLDAVLACGFLFFTNGSYPIIVYMLVLTEFYMSADKTRPAIWMFCIGMPLYAVCYAARLYFRIGGNVEFLPIFRDAFGAAFSLLLHFLVVQIALAFYRQFLKLDRALTELDERKKELEKAYEVVAEVTALEERQRIAKEIHDTAGHSITTVIMQTEAAKRTFDQSPEEAKSKIIAANLQAKHALEELRTSVHLLSGQGGGKTLKNALQDVIYETTDGTGITIRSEIDELAVSEAKHRFLCNTLKEGISNGLRHGGATAFWFELKKVGEKIEFLLSDNGKGVNASELSLGFGLTTMQERAKALGGDVQFVSEQGDGFEIRLQMTADK